MSVNAGLFYSVSSTVEMAALITRPLQVEVLAPDASGGIWVWSAGSVTPADGTNVIAPSGGGPAGRWFRQLGSTPFSVTSLAALKALSVAAPPLIVANQYGVTPGDGLGELWMFRTGNQSANVSTDTTSITWAAPNSDSTGVSGAWQRISIGPAIGKQAAPSFVKDYHGIMVDSTTPGSAVNLQNNAALAAYISEVAATPIGPLSIPAGIASYDAAMVVPRSANGFGLIGQSEGQSPNSYVSMLVLRSTLMHQNVWTVGDAANGTITGVTLKNLSMRIDLHNRLVISPGQANYSAGQITYSVAIGHGFVTGDILTSYGFANEQGFNGSKIVASTTATTIVVNSADPGAATNTDTGRIMPLSYNNRKLTITNAVWSGGSITFTTSTKNYVGMGNRMIIRGMSPDGYNGVWECFAAPTRFTFTMRQTRNTAIPNPGAATVMGVAYPLGNIGTALNGDFGSGWGFLIQRANPALYENINFEGPYGAMRLIGGGDPKIRSVNGTSCVGPLASLMYGGYSGFGWPLNFVTGISALTSGSDTFTDGIPPDFQPSGILVYGNSDGDWLIQAGFTSQYGVRMESNHYYDNADVEFTDAGGPQYWRRGAGSDSTHGTPLYINTDGGGYHFNNIHGLGSLQDGGAGGSVGGCYIGPLVGSVEFSECLWWVYNKEGLKFDGTTLIAVAPRVTRNSAGLWDTGSGTWTGNVITLVARDPALVGGNRGPFLGLQPGDSVILSTFTPASYNGTRTVATVSENYMTITFAAPGFDGPVTVQGHVSIVGLYSGIKLGATCTKAIIVGGEIGDHEGFNGNQLYGFDLSEFTGNLTVAGGDYSGNISGPFSDATKVAGQFGCGGFTILGGKTAIQGALVGGNIAGITGMSRQFNAIDTPSGITSFMNWTTNSTASRRFSAKSRGGGVPGTFAVLSNGDDLWEARDYSSDGAVFAESVRTRSESDGGSSAGSTPGRLVWSTTPSGAVAVVDRWQIDNQGLLRALSGSFSRAVPVTKTADFTVAISENWLINNKSGSTCTVTLPSAATFPGREIMLLNYQAQTVVSATSNVILITGGAAGTAILSANAGRWCTLVSNGTNWVITNGVI